MYSNSERLVISRDIYGCLGVSTTYKDLEGNGQYFIGLLSLGTKSSLRIGNGYRLIEIVSLF